MSEDGALAKLFLPDPIRKVLCDDGMIQCHDLMDHDAMQALAMGGEFALAGGFAPTAGHSALAVFP